MAVVLNAYILTVSEGYWFVSWNGKQLGKWWSCRIVDRILPHGLALVLGHGIPYELITVVRH